MDNAPRTVTDETSQNRVEQDYRSLFHALEEAVFVHDPESGTILEVNERAAELFGYDREDLVGQGIEDVSSSVGLPAKTRPKELLGQAAAGESTTVEWRATDSDGTDFWVEAALSPVEMGGETRVLASIRTVEDRARRERELRTFRSAVENAGHSIYWTDSNGVIEYANPAFESVTGYDRDEAVGLTPRLFKSGEMDETYYEDLWETITAGEVFEHEVVNEDADGERFVINQTIAPITNDTGEVERYVAVNSDITERRRRERRLEAEKDRSEQLRQRLSVLNRVLRHDIRSAVNVIEGNADLVESAGGTPTGAIETIKAEAERLRRLGEEARHVQRAVAADAPNQHQDLSTLVRTKGFELQNEYPDASVEVSVDPDLSVRADQHLDMAVEQLLSNAVEHNDADTPKVSIRATNAGSKVEVQIADDGPGIPEAELQPLRAGEETALEHTSGLGLWIAHWIVNASGGTLSFAENEPRGTVATIELPAAA